MDCGFGCQTAFISFGFIVAYATKRTMILKWQNAWNYHKDGREDIFLPLSETCTEANESDRSPWPGTNETQIIELEFVQGLALPVPAPFQLGIPVDLWERIARLYGNPSLWWISQFIKYLLRYQPETQKMMDRVKKSLNFGSPIVGIHIRRTDKLKEEAAFHAVDEYMTYAAEYFDQLELRRKVSVRRIYLATDDPTVLPEAREKYPICTFCSLYK